MQSRLHSQAQYSAAPVAPASRAAPISRSGGTLPLPVLVGLDGDGYAQEAVRLAANIASATGAQLILLTAYQTPTSRFRRGAAPYQVETDRCLDADTIARMRASTLTSTAFRNARAAHPELIIRQRVTEGPVAAVLTVAAADCGLLVVGARERRGLARLLHRSVSRAVVRDSPCPVAVVRPGR